MTGPGLIGQNLYGPGRGPDPKLGFEPRPVYELEHKIYFKPGFSRVPPARISLSHFMGPCPISSSENSWPAITPVCIHLSAPMLLIFSFSYDKKILIKVGRKRPDQESVALDG